MPDFPNIGCQAIAQYPASYEVHTPTVVQEYVDGNTQRFASTLSMQRVWILRFDRLSENDATQVWDFFQSTRGRNEAFRFQDPWTGNWHEPCWFAEDSLTFDHVRNGVFQGELRIYTEEI